MVALVGSVDDIALVANEIPKKAHTSVLQWGRVNSTVQEATRPQVLHTTTIYVYV